MSMGGYAVALNLPNEINKKLLSPNCDLDEIEKELEEMIEKYKLTSAYMISLAAEDQLKRVRSIKNELIKEK